VTPLARTSFAVLVLATVAAFFLTQRLKHGPALVQHLKTTPVFYPLASGERSGEQLSFHLEHTDLVTVWVVDGQGENVATLARSALLRAYRKLSLVWDGRGDDRRLAPNGLYRVRVQLAHQHRTLLLANEFRLLAVPPVRSAAAGR
jgi:hypothetical protein